MAVAPPPPRVPPLSQLRAFERAARHGGFAAAAAQAGVTAGAIRAQVRGLEAALGAALFHTLPQGVRLSEAGTDLAEALMAAFAQLDAALLPLGKDAPLSALVAFEAAVRLGSFVRAGEEQGLSAAAIAAHVRRVERWAGRPLFDRHARGVTPRPVATACLPDLNRALVAMAQAVSDGAVNRVRIVTLPAIAQLWLAPRLPAMRAALPGLHLSVTATEAMPTAKAAPFDLGIFFAPGGGTVLAEDALVPVCAPALAAAIRTPQDLRHQPRLTDSTLGDDWRHWFAAAAPSEPAPTRGAQHSLYALAVEEALAGAGVLMGHTALVGRYLATSALIAPLEMRVSLPWALRLIALRPMRKGGAVERAAAWLQGA